MSPPTGGHRRSEQGLTLLEMLFALAMFAILLTAVVRLTGDTRFGLMRSEAANELVKRNRMIGTNLRTALSTSEHLLPRDPAYAVIRALITASAAAVSGTPKAVPFSLSPEIVNSQEAALVPPPSATASHWGNELFFVAGLQPLVVTVCYKNCVGTPLSTTVREQVSVKRLQLVHLYLAQDPATRVPGLLGGGLRITEWRSQPFLDVDALSGPPRLTGTVKAAMALGYQWAVSRGQLAGAGTAFYALQNDDAAPLGPATLPPVVPQSHWAFMDEYDMSAHRNPQPGLDRGRIRRGGSGGLVAGPASISVALNNEAPQVNPAWKTVHLQAPGRALRIPRYAQADNGAANFPAGFEIGIWGKPNARLVVLNHALMATGGYAPRAEARHYLAHEAQQHVAVRNE